MANFTTGDAAQAWRPDTNVFAPTDVVGQSLYMTQTSVNGSIEGDAPSVRVAYITDEDAEVVAEGAELTVDNPSLSEVLVHTSKISRLAAVSREMYGQAGFAVQAAQAMRASLIAKADKLLLSQAAPTAPAVAPMAGLQHVSGVIAGGEIADDLDSLVDLIAQLEGNGSKPTAIILDPISWGYLRNLKTADTSNESLLGAGTNDAERRLLGLPVVTSTALTGGLVIDRSAVVSAVGQVFIDVSRDAYFSSDSIGVRGTWRVGHVVVRPNRIGSFTVADSESSGN